MEIIAAVLAAASPVLVTALTAAIKKLRTIQYTEYRKTVLRFIVALLSAGAAVGTALLNDAPVADEVLTGTAQAVLTYIGATGTYFWDKYRTAQVEGRLVG